MLDCSHINNALGEFGGCEPSENGYRVTTHCMYPSFEPVCVFVRPVADGFLIHDGGGAVTNGWHHGLDVGGSTRSLTKSAEMFGCEFGSGMIRIVVENQDWLYSGITSVANASADAARTAVGKTKITNERGLIRKTKKFFDSVSWRPETKLEERVHGASGKLHTYDLAVFHQGSTALIDAVVSHPASIASKYLAFSDTENRMGLYKYAIYDSELTSEDKSLISDVADLVAFDSVIGTDGKFLLQ